MYKYHFFTIAIPTENTELYGKFYDFMINNASDLWVGEVCVKAHNQEEIKTLLEKYVKSIHQIGEEGEVIKNV